MAHLNRTPPHREILAAYFADWSDADLRDFIHAAKDFAARPNLSAELSTATDIARRLAEAELSERQAEHKRAPIEIETDLDARTRGQTEAARVDADVGSESECA